jgi:hypothetical protein
MQQGYPGGPPPPGYGAGPPVYFAPPQFGGPQGQNPYGGQQQQDCVIS